MNKLIRSHFGIFSIISCLIYSTLWHMHTLSIFTQFYHVELILAYGIIEIKEFLYSSLYIIHDLRNNVTIS
jgi:hypothetical protein